jgi:hypothetical protein
MERNIFVLFTFSSTGEESSIPILAKIVIDTCLEYFFEGCTDYDELNAKLCVAPCLSQKRLSDQKCYNETR